MSAHVCPICARRGPPSDYAPFCSRRCADVDLQRWLGGVYAVPAALPGEGDEEPPEAGRAEGDPL